MAQSRQDMRVLVVEDDPSMALIILAQLGKIPCSVSLVENGLMAIRAWIAALEEAPFDAVIMDIHMPVMSGLMALKEIRRLELDLEVPRTSIVAFSADDSGVQEAQCRSVGFDAVLKKPDHIERLVPVIRELTRHTLSAT